MKNLTIGIVVALAAAAVAMAVQTKGGQNPEPSQSPQRKDKVIKTDAEWKKLLTDDQYRILRHGDTEARYCSKFHDNHLEGSYFCAGCKLELFASKAKFDSGTGWPSFTSPAAKDATWIRTDTGFGMIRDEVLCARCDGHLGHVFDDGPKPTGLRYCINSKALLFKRKGSDKFEMP